MILEFKDENAFLSNFWGCKITYWRFGIQYFFDSSEHLFMSFKNTTKEWHQQCSNLAGYTPGQIKRLARKVDLVSNWEDIKYECMTIAVTAKFSQNEDLKAKLLATGKQNLVEGNFHNDKIWGVCLKSSPNVGENYLGRILMSVRDKLGE